MAKTILSGYLLLRGGSTATLHSAAGRLLGFLISHAQATTETVTFYDNTAASGTTLLRIDVHPYRSPIMITFERNAGLAFSTGLHVDQGNCNVSVWSVDYG